MDRISRREMPVIDDPALPQGNKDIVQENEVAGETESSFISLLLRLAERKFFLLKVVLASGMLAAVVSFLWPASYTSTAKIMPPQQGQSSIASALMGQLGQLGPIGALAGNNLGSSKSTTDVYVYVLRSRTVADDLIDRFSLMSVYKDKRRVDARDDLRDRTQITSGAEGGISISVSDRNRQRAADIANGYVDELRKLTKTLAMTEAGRRRIFFEGEVQKAGDELSRAEVAMKMTQERTGIILLEPQSKAMIEGVTDLHAEVVVKEAQVRAMRSFATPENPDLIRAQSELAAIKSELVRLEAGQLGTSLADVNLRKIPEKGLEYVRSLRELKYREAVWDALTKQYEIARVDEAKDAAIIQELDKAVPAEVRSWPKRSLIVLTTILVIFPFAVVIVLFSERLKADTLLNARVQLLKHRLSSGWKR
jgi:tyrosine-protein kinase Etk/Wzc